MTKYYYHKQNTVVLRRNLRMFGLLLFLIGITGLFYVFFPIISWQIYLAPEVDSAEVASPIPQAAILTSSTLQSLIKNTTNLLHPVDYSNAANWFPSYIASTRAVPHHEFYLSVPTLGISDAVVSNADNDLDKHLVNFAGTAYPPAKGNAVVFGHSTLPQWFDPHNYKAIFATALNLKLHDKLIVTENGASYTYVIDNISIVDADDTAPLAQQFDDSYLTLITCTPPGTTWKRLVIHSRLEKLD